jgi:hypothetical protein
MNTPPSGWSAFWRFYIQRMLDLAYFVTFGSMLNNIKLWNINDYKHMYFKSKKFKVDFLHVLSSDFDYRFWHDILMSYSFLNTRYIHILFASINETQSTSWHDMCDASVLMNQYTFNYRGLYVYVWYKNNYMYKCYACFTTHSIIVPYYLIASHRKKSLFEISLKTVWHWLDYHVEHITVFIL